MKLGVSTYSYLRSIRAGRIGCGGIVAHAKATGFDALDISVNDDIRPFLADIKSQLADNGMFLSNYAVGADFLRKDAKSEIERVKHELDTAAEMGAAVFRHDVSAGYPAEKRVPRSFDSAVSLLADCCREIAAYAGTLGIKSTSENHGRFVQDSARIEKLICAVNHENYGALLDIGNFLCADENPLLAVAAIAPYAFHVHAKDFHYRAAEVGAPLEGWFQTRAGNHLRGAIVGHGIVPVRECLKLVKAAGYDGVVSLEFEGMEDSLLAIEAGYRQLRAYFDEIGA